MDTIAYTLRAHNDSEGIVTGATATDDLSDVVNHATLDTANLPAGLSYDSSTHILTWSIPTIAAGAPDVTVTYTVMVAAGAYGVTLKNHATPTGSGDCTSDKTCTTDNPTPHWVLSKTSDPGSGSTVNPGDSIVYTLTAHNDSDATVSGATATDDLSDVVNNATLDTANLPAGLSYSATTHILTWNVPTIKAGDPDATVSYTVTINNDAYKVTVANNVTPSTGGDCVSETGCSTHNPTPHWILSKTSNPANGEDVAPGQPIVYTLHAHNDSDATVSGATAVDTLSDVLDDATLDAANLPAGLSYDAGAQTLTWSVPTIAAGAADATVSYTVTVNDDAHGALIDNSVAPSKGGDCITDDSCEVDHATPHYVLTKWSDPDSGSTVDVGDTVTYTLQARNDSEATVAGATAVDDLSDVLNHATLDTTNLAPALHYDADAQTLTWDIPSITPGDDTTVSYVVTIKPDAFDATVRNVVTPDATGDCGPAGEIEVDALQEGDDENPYCSTNEHVRDTDLRIVKSDNLEGAPVDSGKGNEIGYSLDVSNVGDDAATNVVVTDPMPAGLTIKPGSIVATGWETSTSTDTELIATYVGGGDLENPDAFAAGASSTITLTAIVGTLNRSGIDVPFPSVVNTACISEHEPDANPADNCSTDTTKVKSIAVAALAQCVNDTPIVSYSLTPYNVSSAPKIALIWWTADAYAHRDPSIDASNKAALLANGASQVDYVTLPAGWTNGQTITGRQLWPGAAVDAAGNPIAWPGWTQESDGSWVLDPNAPFYDLRGAAVVEVRINPSTASTEVYPPASPNCNAAPPKNTPGAPGGMADTGSNLGTGLGLGGSLLAVGLLIGAWLTWRRRRQDGRLE